MENNKPILANEIKVEIKGVAKVENNINEVKDFALKLKEYYSKLVFTDEQITVAKNERAGINKTKKKIADYRIAIIKEFKKPIEIFEGLAKETETILSETADFVDVQVKNFEDMKREEKQKEIDKLLKLNTTGVKFSNEKWLNAGYKLKEIETEINEFVTKFNQDMELLKDEDITIKDYYSRTLNISATLLEKKRIEDLRKQEEERKQRLLEIKEVKVEIKQEEPAITFEPVQEMQVKNTMTLELQLTYTEILKLKQFLVENNIDYKLKGEIQ